MVTLNRLFRDTLLPSERRDPPTHERWRCLLHTWSEAMDTAPAKALAESTQRLESVVDHLPQGLVLEDERRRVVRANRAFCAMFSVAAGPEALVGASCEAMAEQAKSAFVDPDGFIERIETILSRQQPVIGDELELVDGRVLERDYMPVFMEDRYRGHLWSYRDVTAQRRAAAKLREAQRAAEAATEAKDAFLAHMSHELRTPLTVVLGVAQLLASTSASDEQQEYVEAITRSGTVVLSLIDDVLDYSKMQAGSFDVVCKRFDLHEALEDAAECQRHHADAKRLAYELVVAGDVPHHVEGDPLRVKQLVMNLASNAVKYTRRGSVTVRALVPKPGWVRVEVRDTGPGIPDGVLPELFRPFNRAAESHIQGSGLGLAITCEIAERLGGAVSGSSVLGEGSCFWFELPMQAAADEPRDQQPRESMRKFSLQAPSSVAPRRGRILVTEDNVLTQVILRRVLERRGHEVTIVSDGDECIEAVESSAFDVLLLDGELPTVSGYVAAARIRELGAHGRRLPIVALTANAAADARSTCLAAGMDDYLRKPFVVSELLEVVERWIPDDAPAAHALPESLANPHSSPALDVRRLRELAGDDDDFRRELVHVFVEDAHERLQELEKEARHEDRARSFAHALKGACGNIGARRMEGLARELERATRIDEARVARAVAAMRAELERVESFIEARLYRP